MRILNVGLESLFIILVGFVLYGSISKFKELQKFASTMATTNTVSLSKFAAYIYKDLLLLKTLFKANVSW